MNPSDPLKLDENLARLLAAFDQGMEGGNDHAKTLAIPQHRPLPGERVVTPLSGTAPNEGSMGELLPPGDGPAASVPTAPVAAPGGNGPHRIGRFELRRQLGKGGCGIVFLAYDPKLEREVALKIPRPEMLLSAEARRRLVREALAAAEFDHPNLVPVYETGEIGPVCYIATAFCPGLTLGEWLDRQAFPVPVRQAARLVATIAEAVQHAHDRGVLHRDLKPNNVILQATGQDLQNQEAAPGSVLLRGEHFIPRVVDFGLAKLIERGAPSETTTRQILGTPKYMAPEQAQARHQDIGPAADVYALGVILYELLTGRAPYDGATDVEVLRQAIDGEATRPRLIRHDIPRDLEAICLKAMDKQPGRRYRTAIDLADDLRRFLDGKPTIARPLKWVGRAARWLRRNDQAVALVVLATIATVLLAVGSWSMYQTRQLKSDRDTVLRDRAARTRADQQREYAEAIRAAAAAWRSGDRKAAAEFLDTASKLARTGGEPTDFVHAYLSRLVAADRLFIATPAGPVTALAVSDDGTRLASGHADGTLAVWDRVTGNLLGSVAAHDAAVRRLAFSRQAARLFSLGGATLSGWSVLPDGRPVPAEEPFRSPAGPAGCLDFVIDGHDLYMGLINGEVGRFDLQNGRRSTAGHVPGPSPATVIARLPEGQGLLAASGTRVYRLLPGSEPQLARDQIFPVTGLLPDAKGTYRFATVNAIHDPDNDSGTRTTRGRVHWLAGLQGHRLAASDSPGRLLVFDHDWHELPTGDTGEIRAGTTTRDGKTLFTGSDDGTIRSWDLPEDLVDHGAITTSPVSGVAIHSSGPWRAAASTGRLTVWSGDERRDVPVPGRGFQVIRLANTDRPAVVGVEFRDGSVVLSETSGSRVQPKSRFTLPGPAVPVSADLSADCSVLAAGDDRGQVHLWNLSDGQLLTSLDCGHRSAVPRVALAADGKTVAAAGTLGLRVWSAGGEVIGQLISAVPDTVFQLSPHGDRLVVAGRNGTIRVYSTAPAREEFALHGHIARVTALRVSPDGRVLVSGSISGEVKFWDLRTGLELFGSPRHSGPVTAIEFAPDGKRLVTGGWQLAVW